MSVAPGPLFKCPVLTAGAPDHPHRGFETISYLLAGASNHKDSTVRVCVHTPSLTGEAQMEHSGLRSGALYCDAFLPMEAHVHILPETTVDDDA
jgi:hypothetical protein